MYLCMHESTVTVCRWCLKPSREKGHERKVRAAQDTPLLKMEAVGDGWIWKKKTTALLFLN